MDIKSTGLPCVHTSRWFRRAGRVIVLGLFLFGMWSAPLALLGPQQASIPGDLADARFNNYVLEHFYRFITGKEHGYWDAPFMYPYKNTIALSDNLLGTAPIYAAIRSGGFSRESAFQLWIIALFALNFWCCFIALRKWVAVDALAASGAYIFAFGIYSLGGLSHLQMLPKFMVPLAFLFFWRHLISGSWKWSALAVLAVVYQFYCGMYLGFMLIYGLFFLTAGHLVLFRRPSYLGRFLQWRFTLVWLLVLACGAALLTPVALPYLHMQHLVLQTETGVRTFADVSGSLPRPVSFFFSHPGALSWQVLSRTGIDVTPNWRDQMQFVGGLPWLAIAMALVLAWVRKVPRMQRATLAALLLSFLLSWVFCLDFAGFSLYRWVFALPGFSALRSVDRIIDVQVMFFVLLFVCSLRTLFTTKRRAWALALCLPLLTMQDNRWDAAWVRHFDKRGTQELITEAKRRITREYGGPKAYDAVAYAPFFGIKDPGDAHARLIHTHLTAMIAAQDLGIPVVNAYTGYFPHPYMGFFDELDSAMLTHWITFNGIGAERVQLIDGLMPEVIMADTVRLQAADGKWVAMGPLGEREARADRDDLGPWESFLRLHTRDGRVAFLCPNDSFLCAGEREWKLCATAMDLGDQGLFTTVPHSDGAISLRTSNGLLVAVDTLTRALHANSTAMGTTGMFKFRTPPFSPLCDQDPGSAKDRCSK